MSGPDGAPIPSGAALRIRMPKGPDRLIRAFAVLGFVFPAPGPVRRPQAGCQPPRAQSGHRARR